MQDEAFKEKVLNVKDEKAFEELKKEYNLDINKEDILEIGKELSETDLAEIVGGKVKVMVTPLGAICPKCNYAMKPIKYDQKDNCGEKYVLFECIGDEKHLYRCYSGERWTKN